MSRSLNIISSSRTSISTSPFSRFGIEDDSGSLVIPNMAEDEVFALFDDFYGASPPGSTTAAPESGDDEFAGLMNDLDEVEEFAELSARQPDSDVLMHDAFSPTLSTLPFDQETSVTTRPTQTAESEMLAVEQYQITSDATPSLDVASAIEPDESAVFQHLTSEQNVAESQPSHNPSPVDTPMGDASSLHHLQGPFNQKSSANQPQLSLESKLSEHQHSQTLALSCLEQSRGTSATPSTGDHRSSMQGEMRKEEEDFTSAELGSLPPFTGFRTGDENAHGHVIDSLLEEGDRRKPHDLSSSRDVGSQQGSAVAQSSARQQAISSQPQREVATTSKPAESPLGLAARKKLKRNRETSPPAFTPVKKPRYLPPVSSAEPPQTSNERRAERGAKATKRKRIDESDSSLTDVSLSAFADTPPGQAAEQITTRSDVPLRGNNKERKDSFATSLREFKAEAPSSTADDEATVQNTPAKSKATPKPKRNNKPAAKVSPATTKATPVPAGDASPAPSKVKKDTKATKAAGRGRKSASVGKDLKGIIQDGVLGDVLKNKGPRQTRSEQKKIADTRPDPALAAKRRHTTAVNYKE